MAVMFADADSRKAVSQGGISESSVSFSVALLLVTALFLGPTACKKSEAPWAELYKRSARSDIDLYLVPKKYALLESSWMKKTAIARFAKEQLIAELAKYGRTLADLQKNPEYQYKEENGEVVLRVGRISHSTAHEYDTSIPLVFYGKGIDARDYGQRVNQQHIAPTLAALLQVRNPNGVETQPLPIVKQQSAKPAIVFVAVIDQGGMNLLRLHKEVAPNIHQLMAKSANFSDAHVGHLDAHTAVGHMAIGTGAYPVKSSVIGNTFFSMEKKAGAQKLNKAEIYATKDETKVSTLDLKSESLADILNVTNAGKSVIVAQSYALRAAVGMAGHGAEWLAANGTAANGNGLTTAVRQGNFVYWLDATKSKWITDTRYFSLPAVAKASDVLLNYAKYYPQGFEGYKIRDTKAALENWGVMMSTPAETQLEGELVRAVISEQIIGAKKHNDGFTDLVYVSFKSADAVGHHFGFESLQARDTLKEIDTQIGKMVEFLEKHYGKDFVFVLSADHGIAPLSEISGGLRLTVEEVMAEIDKLLPPEVAANDSLVHFMTVGQISLNKKLMQQHNISIDMVRGAIRDIRVNDTPFFEGVLTRKDLRLDG
jgi:hypothetical protein